MDGSASQGSTNWHTRHNFSVSLGTHLPDVEATLANLQQHDVVARIWRKDHTVWKPEPTEIVDRLGWLTVTELMSEQVPALVSFAEEVKGAGFRHAVLLGMGGSSLGAEVLRQTCGSVPGYPELIMLDSTLPASVLAVTEAIDPARTLFLVSSKSGGTIETISLYRHFRHLVAQTVGWEQAGRNFVAITDPATSLARLAEAEFRGVFLNPTDVGGRYSVLSYFGLVPAVLMGIDVATLLERADGMRRSCAPHTPTYENTGAWLGAIMGTMAQQGRDKLTLVTSPSISRFGLWVEQLIAESTGKEGKGIIPVTGEPLMEPAHYGDDRLFVCLRLEGDDNATIDAFIEQIKASGQPVVTLRLQDGHDLGAEFFRWEFAIATASAILGVHPFNQPGVQQAKDLTKHLLREYRASGRLPQVATTSSVSELLAQAKTGDYLAIMAYLPQTPEVDQALTELRRRIIEQHRLTTTLGYGPRYLHSTGQLHKDGPDTGLYLQMTAKHERDIPIPGESYTFGVLADAQAVGDFQTLQSLGRRVIRIHLSQGDGTAIRRLTSTLA